jgi:RNA polymerase sigma-70 factor, ECF subfamily
MLARRAMTATGKTGCDCNHAERAAWVEWVGELVHAHRARLGRVARREGLGPQDAFDAVQEAFETFLTLPDAQARFGGAADGGNGGRARGEEARKLLVALTRNVARNRRRLHAVARPHLRDDAALEALADGASGVDELVAAAEEEVRLRGCVQTLADAQRIVVTLRMLDEVPGEDVARTLGITPGHVAVLLHRAKANLLACMTDDNRRRD